MYFISKTYDREVFSKKKNINMEANVRKTLMYSKNKKEKHTLF